MQRFLLYSFMGLFFLACHSDVTHGNKAEVQINSQNADLGSQHNNTKEAVERVVEALPSISAVMGRISPATDTNFVRIDAAYTDKAAIYLQKEAYTQFLKMHLAAGADSVQLVILSATRPFDYQRNIWERKWARLKSEGMTDEKAMVEQILRFSAMPGTSRHHWGTDIDLNYLSNHYFESGKGQRIYDWLLGHASDYGFCQPYTYKGPHRPGGYEEEKWHWSYLPIASKYYRVAKDSLHNKMISGFPGAEYAPELNVVERFVLGVDPNCR